MVISQNDVYPKIDPQHTIVLIIGTPKKVLLTLGNTHIQDIQEAEQFRRQVQIAPLPRHCSQHQAIYADPKTQ